MDNTLGTITRNVTTTLQNIDIHKLFETRDVAVINTDEDNNIFYNPNPNATVVRTADVVVTPDGLSQIANTYVLATVDVVNFSVNDLVTITTQAGAIYETKITVVDTDNDAITIEAASGLTIAATDTITARCYKIPSNFPVIIRSSYFVNGFYVKHKDNTATDLYQLILVSSDVFKGSKLSPFFFESAK